MNVDAISGGHQPTPRPQTSWSAIILESDKDVAEQLMIMLYQKARRQDINITTIAYSNVAEASIAIAARKPFVVSINPKVSTEKHTTAENWAGLDIISTTKRLGIPSILRTSSNKHQVAEAIAERQILALPSRIVHIDLQLMWTEAMLSFLMRPQM